jgi:D-alanyl-D-alanine carboxypeptidase
LLLHLSSHFPEAIITTKTATTFADTNGRQYSAVNTNQQVEKYPQLLFSKTGYTDLAGGNLCVVLTMNGRTIVIVVLGSTKEGRFADVDTLITSVTNYFSPL